MMAAGNLFDLLDVEKRYEIGGGTIGGGAPGLLRRRRPRRQLAALDGVRLSLAAGESVALVGESGSGKSTLLRVLLGLTEPSNGLALFRNQPIAGLSGEARLAFHRDVAMIYQDARGSLDPRMRVRDLIAQPLVHHRLCDAAALDARVAALLAKVGLPGDAAQRYPSQLSGGQVRRVAIARGLAAGPSILVADEAVSGLDVSTQAQLLALLRDLQRQMGLTLLFITHDLGVASYLCERIAVMYLGRIVETGPTRAVLANPAHPYTQALRNASPQFFAPIAEPLAGEIPSPIDLPPGCRFAGRCPRVEDDCRRHDPVLRCFAPQREVACIHPVTPGSPAPAISVVEEPR